MDKKKTKNCMRYFECSCPSPSSLQTLKTYGFNGAFTLFSPNATSPPNFQLWHRKTISLQNSFENIKNELIKARQSADIVALSGNNDVVLKRFADNQGKGLSNLFDILTLDLDNLAGIRPALIHSLLSEFHVVLEIDVSQLFNVKLNRAKLIGNARHAVRYLIRRRKGNLRLIISGGVSVRDVQELQAIGMLFGLSELDANNAISVNVESLVEEAESRKRLFLETVDISISPTISSLLLSANKVKQSDESTNKRMLLAKAWTS